MMENQYSKERKSNKRQLNMATSQAASMKGRQQDDPLRKLLSTLDRIIAKSNNNEASDNNVDMTETCSSICNILDNIADIVRCVVYMFYFYLSSFLRSEDIIFSFQQAPCK